MIARCRGAAGVAALLAACSDSRHQDLQAFVEAAEQQAVGEIVPGPALVPAVPVAYAPGGLRDPFEPLPASRDDAKQDSALATPDLQRPKTRLEEFPIDALRMVGTLEQEGARQALVRDPAGHFHGVRTGDYLGTDFGRVDAIGAAAIDLVESIPDGSGGWVLRRRTLPISYADTASPGRPERHHEAPRKE